MPCCCCMRKAWPPSAVRRAFGMKVSLTPHWRVRRTRLPTKPTAVLRIWRPLAPSDSRRTMRLWTATSAPPSSRSVRSSPSTALGWWPIKWTPSKRCGQWRQANSTSGALRFGFKRTSYGDSFHGPGAACAGGTVGGAVSVMYRPTSLFPARHRRGSDLQSGKAA